ncbi:uncharacterized protein [Ptychodera flava]
MAMLFMMLHKLLILLSIVLKSVKLEELASQFPHTFHGVRTFLGLERDNFQKFVMCPKCHTRYDYNEAFEVNSRGKKKSKTCTHITFPNHPHRKQRRPCGAFLMKTVRGKNGAEYLYPKRLFCYRSIKETLQELLKRPGFLQKCQEWKQRDIPDGILADVYDGRVWQEFMPKDRSDHAFAAMLNVDWFQPYKHTNDSVGVIYLILQNLPRTERFKPENIVLVGLIPGPTEPKRDINPYLDPLVDELLEMWDGVQLNDSSFCGWNIYSMTLLCLSCDIPACRKCGGFLGHSAEKGCNKCLRSFQRNGFGSKADYSGFNPEDWERRTNEEHRLYAAMAQQARTQAERQNIESKYGARYSSLFRLPYYDAVRFSVIDPMHNLLLGTAKHVLKVWKERNVVSDDAMEEIQRRVNEMKTPSDVGRIPSKISSGFSGFTADQWRNWTCIYSLYAIQGFVRGEHLDCWKQFVYACRVLCSRTVSVEKISAVHTYLRLFCKKFEKIYGPEMCTPNMHLHLHLKECLLDYGPAYSFWLFSCERYNGILGNFPTNNRAVEVQLMRKFMQGFQVYSMQCDSNDNLFSDMWLTFERNCTGSLAMNENENNCYESYVKKTCDNLKNVSFSEADSQVPIPPTVQSALDFEDLEMLEDMYSYLYPSNSVKVVIALTERFSRIFQDGQLYSLATPKSRENAHVVACWCDMDQHSGLLVINPKCQRERAGIITELFRSEIMLQVTNGKLKKVSHLIARVEWLTSHPFHNHFGGDVTVWGTTTECTTSAQFIPLERIRSRCAVSVGKVKFPYESGNRTRILEETVTVTVPLRGVSI